MFKNLKNFFFKKLSLFKHECTKLIISFLSIILSGFFFFIFLFLFFIFLSISLSIWISNYYKNYILGFGITALIYFIIIIFFFVINNYWLNKFLKNFLTRIIFKKNKYK